MRRIEGNSAMATAYANTNDVEEGVAMTDAASSPVSADAAAAPTAKASAGQTGAGQAGADASRPNPFAAKAVKWIKGMAAPLTGIVIFLALWAVLAPQVQTSLGALPGPVEVAAQGAALYEEWGAASDLESQFYADQEARNEAAIAAGNTAGVTDFDYSGPPTFLDQIMTSLKTVAMGFILATLAAVPIGLVCGLYPGVNAAINPLVQIMKPVSPLAWLPIVTMVISALVTSPDPVMPKSTIISALVVMLCSLWPTLINTAVGASSIDKDLLNVGRVLKLGWFAKLTRLVLPSSLPYIFTGMRLSLGVGWMVLIAAEMLSQNPGLGKFVWDEFQNGSSQSLARIMFAVVVIGFIGFGLDRVMMALQNMVSRNRIV
jgi:nitrate/nitrite transport system permease protein